MRRLVTILCLSGWLAACAAAPRPLHDLPTIQANEAVWCIGPDGALVPERFGADGKVTCPAPGRFVRLPFCTTLPPSPSNELAYLRARGRASRDGSLYGDRFEGHPFCAPPKLGPPRPLF